MSQGNSINATLIKNLFVAPKPINAKLYKEVKPYAFPIEKYFIDFLSTEDFDKKVEYGELVLQTLCYSNNFFPPSAIYKNLYHLEKLESTKAHDHFVGRDHFLHLIYLYLLGLYIFFYFPVLNKKITNLLERRRRDFRKTLNTTQPSNLILAANYDFITIWKQFILIHDLGYPVELSSEKISSLSNLHRRTRNFIYCFKNLKEEILRDFSLRALSRIISLFQVCQPSEDETFQTMVLDNTSSCFSWDVNNNNWIEESPDQTFLSNWNNALFIDKAITKNCVKSLTSVLSWTSLIAVLYQNDYENPVLIINPGDQGRGNKIVFTKKVSAKLRNENHLVNAFIDGKTHSKNYFWRYYCVNPIHELRESLKQIFNDELLDNIEEAHKILAREIPHEVSLMDGETDFVNFGFHTLDYISNIFGDFRYDLTDHNTDTVRNFAVHNSYFSMNKEATKIYINEISNKLDGFINKNYIDISNEFFTGQPISSELLDKFKKAIELSDTLHTTIFDKIKSISTGKIKFHETLYNSWIKIKNSLNNMANYENFFKIENGSVLLNLNAIESVASNFDFNDRLRKNKSDNFVDILKSYCSPIFPQRNLEKNRIDHGVISSLVFLELFQAFNHFGNELFNSWSVREEFDGQKCLLNLAFNAHKRPRGGNLLYQSKNLLFEPIFATLIHNIGGFPNNRKPQAVKIEKEPFAYLAILADELQNWGRPQVTNLLSGRRREHTPSQDFDIKISYNQIIVSEKNIESDIQSREQTFKKKLSNKLDRADNYIRLHLMQK